MRIVLAGAEGALAGLVEEAGHGEEMIDGLALEVLELIFPEARGLAVHGKDAALLVGGEDGLADGVDDGGEAALGGEELVVLTHDHADQGPEDEEAGKDERKDGGDEDAGLGGEQEHALALPGFAQGIHGGVEAVEQLMGIDILQLGEPFVIDRQIALGHGRDNAGRGRRSR